MYGSSPRVWGKELRYHRLFQDNRIIPTGVGKSNLEHVFKRGKSDHPHGCGEKENHEVWCGKFCGSSPRVWGKAISGMKKKLKRRIIPTGVGKSFKARKYFCSRPDHPHGCGEKTNPFSKLSHKSGSSPRVWGKGWVSLWDTDKVRIIPTGVGKREGVPGGSRTCTDHPHGCGEKALPIFLPSVINGSSPRVWGKGPKHSRIVLNYRIIPTGVGKRTT